MEKKRYFNFTNFTSHISIFLGIIILTIAVVSFVFYKLDASFNLVYQYYSKTNLSEIPAMAITLVETIISIIFIIVGVLVIKQKRVLGFAAIFFVMAAVYFISTFFILLGFGFFDYFSIQSFAYVAYFIFSAVIAASYILQKKEIEVKLIWHSEKLKNLAEELLINSKVNEVQPITNITNANILNIENSVALPLVKLKKEQTPGVSFNFVEPTLENKTEEEQLAIKKIWEATAEKLSVLKYSELKKIAEQQGIEIHGNVKKITLIELLKKVVKIYVQKKDLQSDEEVSFNENKMAMFTLAELKNISRGENINIATNARKVEYINRLKKHIDVTIELMA